MSISSKEEEEGEEEEEMATVVWLLGCGQSWMLRGRRRAWHGILRLLRQSRQSGLWKSLGAVRKRCGA